jgi:hypothetical protein
LTRTGDEGDLALAVVLGGHVDDFDGGGHGCVCVWEGERDGCDDEEKEEKKKK